MVEPTKGAASARRRTYLILDREVVTAHWSTPILGTSR